MIPKILIGVPTGEMAKQAIFYDLLDDLIKPEGFVIKRMHGPSVAKNRNLLIQIALFKMGATHVLFLDDDMFFQKDLLMRLLAHDVDIVMGLTVMKAFPLKPVVFDHIDEQGNATFSSFDHTGLQQKAGGTLSCTLIKTSVFLGMRSPWMEIGQINKDELSEDINFFRKCTVPIHCDFDAHVGHFMQVVAFPNKKLMGQTGAYYE